MFSRIRQFIMVVILSLVVADFLIKQAEQQTELKIVCWDIWKRKVELLTVHLRTYRFNIR